VKFVDTFATMRKKVDETANIAWSDSFTGHCVFDQQTQSMVLPRLGRLKYL